MKRPRGVLQLWAPEALVVVAYGLLLPREILPLPRYGCLNIHASLLPRWRGAAPIQRAILAGDQQTGVTIMQMDQGLDTGALLSSRVRPISATDTGGSVHDALALLGAAALLETLEAIAAGRLIPVPQPPQGRHLRCEDRQGRGPHRLDAGCRGDRAAGAGI